jgi:hypothetical protein
MAAIALNPFAVRSRFSSYPKLRNKLAVEGGVWDMGTYSTDKLEELL